MPNIKSAIKRVKVSQKKNLVNRINKTRLKTALRKFNQAVSADSAAAAKLLPVTSSAIDKAATKGVIHKNAANRRKSRAAKRLNKLAANA